MCVEGREGSVQHAAPHLGVPVIQCIGNKEEEEWGDLRVIQVLGQLVQRQSNSTPEQRVHKKEHVKLFLNFFFYSLYDLSRILLIISIRIGACWYG